MDISHSSQSSRPDFNALGPRMRRVGSAASAPIPVNTVLPTLSGTGYIGATLTVSIGTWINTSTWSYQWLSDGVAIFGATSTTYTITSATEGTAITCQVTGISADGSTAAVTAAMHAWMPSDLGVNLHSWYDLQHAGSVTVNSGKVAALADRSGNGYDASQPTGANQPTYVASSLIGSKPAMRSSSTSQYLDIAATGSIPLESFMAVGTFNGGSTPTRYMMSGTAGGNAGNIAIGSQASKAGLTSITRTPSSTNDINTITGIVHEGVTAAPARLYINGLLNNSNASVTRTAAMTAQRRLMSEGTNGAVGDFGELVLVTSDVTGATREKIEGYIAHRWGQTSLLAADHPYKTTPPTV